MKSFSNYAEMPVTNNEKPNTWFSSHITTLKLTIANSFVVELTKSNSAIIEADLKANPSYNLLFTKKMFEYYRLSNGGVFPEYNKDAILDLIVMIDYENSTNIWRYKDKRDYINKMVDYIINPSNNFWQRLDKGDVSLVDDLNPEVDKIKGPRSLSSKVCKYLSEMKYSKHNYYINDTVVRHVLPYYLNYFGLPMTNKTRTYFDNISYSDLFGYLDAINNHLGNVLNRDEIDRIMWYCYRYE